MVTMVYATVDLMAVQNAFVQFAIMIQKQKRFVEVME